MADCLCWEGWLAKYVVTLVEEKRRRRVHDEESYICFLSSHGASWHTVCSGAESRAGGGPKPIRAGTGWSVDARWTGHTRNTQYGSSAYTVSARGDNHHGRNGREVVQ